MAYFKTDVEQFAFIKIRVTVARELFHSNFAQISVNFTEILAK